MRSYYDVERPGIRDSRTPAWQDATPPLPDFTDRPNRGADGKYRQPEIGSDEKIRRAFPDSESYQGLSHAPVGGVHPDRKSHTRVVNGEMAINHVMSCPTCAVYGPR